MPEPSEINRYLDSHFRELYERIERLEASRDTDRAATFDRFTALATKLAILEERSVFLGGITSLVVSTVFSIALEVLKK
jgi:hypothetical protein